MKQKDLAEEYLTKAKGNAIYFKDSNFPDMPLYQENDIKAAFNAGRDSVVENMPDLRWRKVCYLGREFIMAYPYGCHYAIEFVGMEFELFCNRQFVTRSISLSHAKQAANEHYKEQIKQALGL
ncbi:MAG: hypothetical protein ACFN1F_01950 [Segatella sp.]